MTSLVVVAHPDSQSLTHCVADRTVRALTDAGVETGLADLAAEGFDPRFTLTDRRHYLGAEPTPADVLAEQTRLDAVDDLVIVFPVYWWSMPALLKGWIDRVFIAGWAFDYTPGVAASLTPRLGRMRIHLIMVAGDDAGAFARRAYDTALRTQIETGIVGYCGAGLGSEIFVHESESKPRATLTAEIDDIAASVVSAVSASAESALPIGGAHT